MMTPIGRYEFGIDAYLTDFRGKATLPMIGGFMLQAATKHAEERGFGYSAMTSQQRVWVLSRIAIEVFEYPKNDTVMVLKTWVASVNRLFTERHFSFEDEQGREIGFAKSLWASIDLVTRKPTNVLELEGLSDYITEKENPIEGMTKIPALKDDYEIATDFVVKYSDVDINKHLNSMKYIEHFVDVFDIDMFREKEIRRIEINYISEGRYGTKLDILKRTEKDSIFVLEMKDGDTSVCSTRVTWK
ncbi:MAG: acyl-[acyl-carrier-protein] thioesterase [Dysgonomonas sp.]|jgi:acyl-ACP thioesterase|uniref:acyl-[acyl-carrier-protein] thioesterase n=1 Tax=unclassified Dysgonomonas TaxID=2630389 RepID=UPI0025BAE695|nr:MULTISPECIES: acyl-ACP thioesterase domain-containing protein [unclassified Dysgonomonas]MDR1717775.1 acyl-[acyl-carrier-protein] thioesterase [Prevotella sp.]MDR2004688.1 acyl-[acyl-carrier-protein] thioesterase [Prevotella sp.]HMM01783.1 thioesterase [Dysgonomonas sp.]